ncbi:MAG: hypothetical protein JW768_11830 [Chitinispirillaceae bacterium]|nr:hypothetical protein [Chitinispirillaceae bacterium]
MNTNDKKMTAHKQRYFVACAAASLVLIVIASWFSFGFYGYDEHFQMLEPVSVKLGWSSFDQLPWDFQQHDRQWFQPFFYYIIARLALWFGIENPLALNFIFKLATGLFGWTALVVLARYCFRWIDTERSYSILVATTFLSWFIPFILVRTSSETFSGTLFMLGMVTLLWWSDRLPAFRNLCMSAGWGLFAGLLLGCAFMARYQVMVMVAGLFSWVIVFKKEKIRISVIAAAGFLIALVLGIAIDKWGYGAWVNVPWNYFKAQIIYGVASGFGTDPFYGYLYLLPGNPFFVLVAVIMVACITFWIKRPAHIITWVTLPFFLVHCFISHKEPRFMWPLAVYAGLYCAVAFGPASWIWSRRMAPVRVPIYALNAVALLLLCLIPINPDMQMQRFIKTHWPSEFACLTINYDPFRIHSMTASFFRPTRYSITTVSDYDSLEKQCSRLDRPIYFSAYHKEFPAQASALSSRVHVVHASISIKRRIYMVTARWFPSIAAMLDSRPWDGSIRYLYRIDPPLLPHKRIALSLPADGRSSAVSRTDGRSIRQR